MLGGVLLTKQPSPNRLNFTGNLFPDSTDWGSNNMPHVPVLVFDDLDDVDIVELSEIVQLTA